MKTSDVLYVFKNNPDQPLVGRIIFEKDRITFTYAKSYATRSASMSINPFYLPLNDQQRTFVEPELNGVLTVFRDALPGKWGSYVIEKVKGKKLGQQALLLEDQQDRIGDLVFNADKSFPDLSRAAASQELFDWDEIIAAKNDLDNQQPLSEKQKALWFRGSSQGGARPKFSVSRNAVLYMVKAPSRFDYGSNNPQIEHGTLQLAKHCGIDTVESELFQYGGMEFILLKRFDRNEQGICRPFLSLASACAVKKESASYIAFADELRRLGCADQLPQLFRRMLFNVLISNKDDHLFNHGMLYIDSQWRLSPAFDVVAGEGQSRNQSLIVGRYGAEATIRNALSYCNAFTLSPEEAREIAEDMIRIMQRDWKNIFTNAGVSAETIASIEWAVLHDDVFIDFECLRLPG